MIPSFETAARDCYAALKEGWKNRRQANWISSFENHVFPVVGTKPVNEVDSAVVVDVLSPIWLEIPDTARRMLQRIGAVLDFLLEDDARVIGFCDTAALPYTAVMQARAALPGGELPNWT